MKTILLLCVVVLLATAAPGWGQFIRVPVFRPRPGPMPVIRGPGPGPVIVHVPGQHGGGGHPGSGEQPMPFVALVFLEALCLAAFAASAVGTFVIARKCIFVSNENLRSHQGWIGKGNPVVVRVLCILGALLLMALNIGLAYCLVSFASIATVEVHLWVGGLMASVVVMYFIGPTLLRLASGAAGMIGHSAYRVLSNIWPRGNGTPRVRPNNDDNVFVEDCAGCGRRWMPASCSNPTLCVFCTRLSSIFAIRIVAIPPGDAPEHVRQAWVGLELPLRNGATAPAPEIVVGALSGKVADFEPGYVVDGILAIHRLAAHSPEAAAWWRENAPLVLKPGYDLFFPSEACERVALPH